MSINIKAAIVAAFLILALGAATLYLRKVVNTVEAENLTLKNEIKAASQREATLRAQYNVINQVITNVNNLRFSTALVTKAIKVEFATAQKSVPCATVDFPDIIGQRVRERVSAVNAATTHP